MSLIPSTSLPAADEPVQAGLHVLNCTAGDMTFSFDPSNPDERARSATIVQDLLQRGYLLFAKVDDAYHPVKAFNPELCEYTVLAGPPPVLDTPSAPAKPPKKPKAAAKQLPADKTNVVAVAPTAGG